MTCLTFPEEMRVHKEDGRGEAFDGRGEFRYISASGRVRICASS